MLFMVEGAKGGRSVSKHAAATMPYIHGVNLNEGSESESEVSSIPTRIQRKGSTEHRNSMCQRHT